MPEIHPGDHWKLQERCIVFCVYGTVHTHQEAPRGILRVVSVGPEPESHGATIAKCVHSGMPGWELWFLECDLWRYAVYVTEYADVGGEGGPE